MKFSAPKKVTWWVAVALGVVGTLGFLVKTLPVVTGDLAVYFVVAGFALLAIATAVKGL